MYASHHNLWEIHDHAIAFQRKHSLGDDNIFRYSLFSNLDHRKNKITSAETERPESYVNIEYFPIEEVVVSVDVLLTVCEVSLNLSKSCQSAVSTQGNSGSSRGMPS